VRQEPADQFWGERHGQVVDPFGHRWQIAERVRDVAPEELAAGAAKAKGSG
jgi:PhnB protein